MAIGRPSKYKPIYAKRAKQYLAEGYSKKATCGLLGISQDCFYKWIKDFPSFAESIEEGSHLGEAAYLKLMKNMASGDKGNCNAAIFMLKNLFRYSDTPVESEDSKPIQIQFVVDKPKDDTDANG